MWDYENTLKNYSMGRKKFKVVVVVFLITCLEHVWKFKTKQLHTERVPGSYVWLVLTVAGSRVLLFIAASFLRILQINCH